MLSSLVFRAIRNALRSNPTAQERILGASLLAMAIADVSHLHNRLASSDDLPRFTGNPVSMSFAYHPARSEQCCIISVAASFICLPDSLRYHPELWNPTTHGNISFVIVLLLFRFVRGDSKLCCWLICVPGLRGFWVLGARGIILGRGRSRRVAGQSTTRIWLCCV